MKQTLTIGLVVLFILAGCSSTGGGGFAGFGKSKETDPAVENVYSGTTGIEMFIEEDKIPEKLFVNSEFPIIINVFNKGTHDVENGKIVFGIEQDYNTFNKVEKTSADTDFLTPFDPADRVVSLNIEGKTPFNPKGGKEILVVYLTPRALEGQSERHRSLFTSTVCYQYKTEASETVCIDPDITGLKTGVKACQVQEKKLGSQGAPLAVTKIETQMIQDSKDDKIIIPQFLIHIENKGKGQVVRQDHYGEFCSKESAPLTNKYFNVLQVEATLSGETLECVTRNPSISGGQDGNFIKLKDGADFIRCKLKNGVPKSLDAYLAPLQITLEYGYTDTVSTDYVTQDPTKY